MTINSSNIESRIVSKGKCGFEEFGLSDEVRKSVERDWELARSKILEDRHWSELPLLPPVRFIKPKDYRSRINYEVDMASVAASDMAKEGNGQRVFFGEMEVRENGVERVGYGPINSRVITDSRLSGVEVLATRRMEEAIISGDDYALWISPPNESLKYVDTAMALWVRDEGRLKAYNGIANISREKVEKILEFVHNNHQGVVVPQGVDDLRAIPITGRGLTKEHLLLRLSQACPELSQMCLSFLDGEAENRSKRAEETIRNLKVGVDQFLASKNEKDTARAGRMIEMGIVNAGWGLRNDGGGCVRLYGSESDSSDGVYMNGLGGVIAESSTVWQKPLERWVLKKNKDGKTVFIKEVKIEKCGYHLENGGNCTWRPNNYVEVGSLCPKCGKKFVCV